MNPRLSRAVLSSWLIAAVAGVTTAAAQDLRHGVYLPLDEVEIVSTSGATVTLEGNAVFAAPDFQVAVDLDPHTDRPVSVSVGVDLNAAFTVELSAESAGDFEHTLSPAPVLLPPIAFGGATQVVPVLSLRFTVEGQAEAGMRMSLVQELRATLAATVGRAVGHSMPPPPVSYANASVPEVSGTTNLGVRASVEATVQFLIVYQGLTIGGPQFLVGADLQLAVVPAANPWWDLDLRVELGVGVSGPGFGHTETVWSETLDVADAGGPFPGGLPQTRWSKAYQLEDHSHVASIAPWGDGFAFGGRAADGWFAGLEHDGSPVWEKQGTIVVGGATEPREVQATLDGGLVSGGEHGVLARVERFDASGDLLWTRMFPDGLGDIVTLDSLVAREDGGFVFAGLVGRGLDQHPVVVWLDQDGQVEDALEVDFGTVEDEGGFRQIVATADGGFAAVGFVVYADHPDIGQRLVSGRNGLVVKFDADHEVEFAKVMGGIGYDDLFGITELEDGALMACGAVGNEDDAAWLVCLESDGSERWSGIYSGSENPYEEFVAVSAVEGGGAIAAGTSGLAAGRDSWMLRVDARGMPVWLKSLRGPHQDELLELRALPDGLVACGLTKSLDDDPIFTAEQGWIVRANIDGMLHFDAALGFDAVNDPARWDDTAHAAVLDIPATALVAGVVAEDGVLVPEDQNSVITVLAQ